MFQRLLYLVFSISSLLLATQRPHIVRQIEVTIGILNCEFDIALKISVYYLTVIQAVISMLQLARF